MFIMYENINNMERIIYEIIALIVDYYIIFYVYGKNLLDKVLYY